jgi:hypothetical protein
MCLIKIGLKNYDLCAFNPINDGIIHSEKQLREQIRLPFSSCLGLLKALALLLMADP